MREADPSPFEPLRALRGAVLPLVLLLLATVHGCGCGKSEDSSNMASDMGGPPEKAVRGSDSPWPTPLAHVRLVAERPFLEPGRQNLLGVTFEITPGWHLFWKGRNDSGMYPRVSLKAPPGFEVGEMLWPAPERKVAPGNILDYVYENSVTLILPVNVPEEVTEGRLVGFSAKVDWMACREACVPESARVELELPVARSLVDAWPAIARARDAGRPLGILPSLEDQPKIGALFTGARLRLPERLDGDLPGAARTWSGSTLTLRLETAGEIYFYPAEDCAPLENPIRDGAVEGNTLSLAFRGPPEAVTRVRGVLEFRFPNREGLAPRIYSVDWPGPVGG